MRFTHLAALWLFSPACYSGNAFTTDYPVSRDPQSYAVAGEEADCPGNANRVKFCGDDKGFGDAAVAPFGDEVEYKINALNYTLYLGDALPVPFQLYYGELASNESPETTNERVLLDPTQGIAVQFPWAYRYKDSALAGVCEFSKLAGYCVAGLDLTLRGVRVNETNDAGEVSESLIFGASASVRASVLFPIFEEGVPGGGQAGHLSASIGGRYYYHNTDNQNLLFGEIADPTGAPVTFEKDFGALTAETEFDIYKYFKIRLEYFRPLANRDVLGDIFKASVVFAQKKETPQKRDTP